MKGIKKTKGIQGKLILYFVILVFGITLVTGYIQYKTSSQQLIDSTRQEVAKLASAAALIIDGDSHQTLTKPEDKSSDTYKEIKAKMQNFQKATGVKYIYTLVQNGNNATKFVVDAAETDSADLGYEYDYSEPMGSAFNGTASADKDMYTDEWGTFLSGYAPIKNSEGKVVAIVGVDIDSSSILQQQKQIMVRIIIGIIIGLILTLILSIFISRKIVKPIHQLANLFKELSLSGGDLTKKIEIKTGDELEILGSSITEFISNIRDIVVQISTTADYVTGSAEGLNKSIKENLKAVEEVTVSIQNIASGATDQAGNVSDISDTIQNIAADMNENKLKISNINNSVEVTRKHINNGIVAVNNQTVKTDESLNAFKNVKEAVGKLVSEAEEVKSILSTITAISNQTNLLALNASIEASRAGENGRGFSVVADEVRKLAERSKIAASEVGEVLQRIHKDAKDAVDQINKSDLISAEQKEAVNITSSTFKEIAKETENMITSIHSINTSFKTISEKTNSIADKTLDISSVSQENAAISEEVSASSEEQNASMEEMAVTAVKLQQLSGNLKNVISKFEI